MQSIMQFKHEDREEQNQIDIRNQNLFEPIAIAPQTITLKDFQI